MQLAIYAPTLPVPHSAKPFGKDIANHGLIAAMVRYGRFDQLTLLSAEPPEVLRLFKEQLIATSPGHASAVAIQQSELLDLSAAAAAGTLLRGQPYLGELAWARARLQHQSTFSLAGVIHTLAPPRVRELIGEVLIAPVQPWDALICTSPSVRNSLEQLLDRWQHHLQQRLGARRFIRPQLPVIPLGVDRVSIEEQRSDAGARRFLRSNLALADEDLLVLWIGRLSYYEKAFPQAMFIAMQRAARRTSCRLHFVMAGWFPDGDVDHHRYREAADRHAPDLKVHFLDGRNPEVLRSCWAAADLFLSLVDNPQETFGLAPVEAMAAGLPLVVSDWDGYRYTVQDGVEGFRIPTLMPPANDLGLNLALEHDFGQLTYQNYAGSVAQHVAVDIDRAASVIACLADTPDLRRRMGEAGRRAVRDRFDWPVVAGVYRALFEDLERRRLSAVGQRETAQANPLRDDPFSVFSGFASNTLSSRGQLRLLLSRLELEKAVVQLCWLDECYADLRLNNDELQSLLGRLEPFGSLHRLDALSKTVPCERRDALLLTLAWLVKQGFLEYVPESFGVDA